MAAPQPTTTIKGDKLIIEVDVSAKAFKAAKPSGSGKTRMVCSTGGFSRVDGSVNGLRISLNVIIPLDDE